VQDGCLLGFLVGLLVLNRGERMAVVPDFGHGVEDGRAYDLYRRMYAALADQWLENGCFLHAVSLYPNEGSALAAWGSLGFGLMVVDALRTVEVSHSTVPAISDRLQIRRADVRDTDTVAWMERALGRHLSSSPCFLPLLQEGKMVLEQWLAEEGHALWIAFSAGQPVGYLRFQPSERFVLPTSDDSVVAITGAYVREDLRGSGVGTALLERGLAWARDSGYALCSVDFESANLPGSAFWLRHFSPVVHSLVRRIDARLAWAHARRPEADLVRAYQGHSWAG
jgi:GNAT superfamily N-acetyltransferase